VVQAPAEPEEDMNEQERAEEEEARLDDVRFEPPLGNQPVSDDAIRALFEWSGRGTDIIGEITRLEDGTVRVAVNGMEPPGRWATTSDAVLTRGFHGTWTCHVPDILRCGFLKPGDWHVIFFHSSTYMRTPTEVTAFFHTCRRRVPRREVYIEVVSCCEVGIVDEGGHSEEARQALQFGIAKKRVGPPGRKKTLRFTAWDDSLLIRALWFQPGLDMSYTPGPAFQL
jgi:hypothetical protein